MAPTLQYTTSLLLLEKKAAGKTSERTIHVNVHSPPSVFFRPPLRGGGRKCGGVNGYGGNSFVFARCHEAPYFRIMEELSTILS